MQKYISDTSFLTSTTTNSECLHSSGWMLIENCRQFICRLLVRCYWPTRKGLYTKWWDNVPICNITVVPDTIHSRRPSFQIHLCLILLLVLIAGTSILQYGSHSQSQFLGRFWNWYCEKILLNSVLHLCKRHDRLVCSTSTLLILLPVFLLQASVVLHEIPQNLVRPLSKMGSIQPHLSVFEEQEAPPVAVVVWEWAVRALWVFPVTLMDESYPIRNPLEDLVSNTCILLPPFGEHLHHSWSRWHEDDVGHLCSVYWNYYVCAA